MKTLSKNNLIISICFTLIVVLTVMLIYNMHTVEQKIAKREVSLKNEAAKYQEQLVDYQEQDALYKSQIDTLETNVSKLESELQSTKEELATTTETLDRFVNPIEYDSAAAPTYNIPLSTELQEYTYLMCSYYDIVDYYEVMLGMMWQESNFNANAISATNDYGLMQINICNHEYLKNTLGIVDILDAESNIESGIYIFANLIHKHGDADKALMAYNMGSGGASVLWDRGIYSTTYSNSVLDKAELIALDKYSEK